MAQAYFILPEMNKLVREAKSGAHYILFISYGTLFSGSIDLFMISIVFGVNDLTLYHILFILLICGLIP